MSTFSSTAAASRSSGDFSVQASLDRSKENERGSFCITVYEGNRKVMSNCGACKEGSQPRSVKLKVGTLKEREIVVSYKPDSGTTTFYVTLLPPPGEYPLGEVIRRVNVIFKPENNRLLDEGGRFVEWCSLRVSQLDRSCLDGGLPGVSLEVVPGYRGSHVCQHGQEGSVDHTHLGTFRAFNTQSSNSHGPTSILAEEELDDRRYIIS